MVNCEEFLQIKQKYLRGEVTPGEEKAVEEHLENCPACRQSLDECLAAAEKNSEALKEKWSEDCGLDEKKQRRILMRARYKNRIGTAGFLLLLMAVLSIAGSFLSSLYFNWGGENSRLYRTQKTAALLTEFTFPNVTMPLSFAPHHFFSRAGWGHSSVEIKPYFVAMGNYALQKQVGKDSKVIGHLNVNQLFSSVLTRRQWADGSYQHYFYFYYPDQLSDLSDNGRYIAEAGEDIWQALDILPEGTVAEMALSFREVYSIDQVKDMLDEFDLDITWYALATGTEGTSRDHREPLSTNDGAWGMPDLPLHMLSQNSTVSDEDIALREEYFLESMKFLVANEKIARRVYQGNPQKLLLEQRYQYIKDNGIQVYGVVVTGPTKELLKLQNLESVHSPALGDVGLWNWFNRSFSGTIY